MDINVEEVLTELGRQVAINSHLNRRMAQLEQRPYDMAKLVIKEMGEILDEFEGLIDDIRFSSRQSGDLVSEVRMADLGRDALTMRERLKEFDEKYPGVRHIGLPNG